MARKTRHHTTLYRTQFTTPLGPMIVVADSSAVHLLEFVERKHLARELQQLEKEAMIVDGRSAVLDLLQEELAAYFAGRLQNFTTPIATHGSMFQDTVWRALQRIAYGTTYSYAQLAQAIERPTACRAVARANSTNQLALIIPCHRVVNANGEIGGYAAGCERKQWLLAHEAGWKNSFE